MRYLLLGPVTVIDGDRPLRLGGPKQQAVLAGLLLRANQVVSDEQLCGLVWGKDAPAGVRGQLQIYVSGLRKLLGKTTILRRLPGYLIEVAPDELDLQVFSSAVEQAVGDLAAGLTERASDRLRSALALWRGPALGGTPESFVECEGPALEERRLAAFEYFFDAELAMDRPAQLVGDLRRLVQEHPLRERLSWQLMLALYCSGRASDALVAYTDIRLTLAAELGIDPGGRLQELYQRILRGDDPGEQVEATPQADLAVPDVRSAELMPAELPHDVRGFTGRRGELAMLARDFDDWGAAADPAVSIWVISGMAGVGKTALAVRWAHSVRARFPAGQLYVDLRGFDAGREPLTPGAALTQLLRALGIEPGRIPDEPDELTRLYRSVLAGRKMLLVLDNAHSAEQVRPLLPGRSTVVLVTSRHRLGDLMARDGARPLPLSVLPAEDSYALLSRVLGDERVSAEPGAAAELAGRCGHLPLALRLAASTIDAGIAEGMAELIRGGFLAGLAADGAQSRSVSAAFAVSYESMSPGLRRLFRNLALVPGPDFTAHMAAALDGGTLAEASHGLRALAAANLVERRGPGRYRLHGLLRMFAAGLGAPSPPGVAGDRDDVERELDGCHRAQIGVVLPNVVHLRSAD